MLSISLTQDSSYAKIHHVDVVPCALYQSWNCTEERCPELLSFSEQIKIRTRLLKGAWTSIFLKIRTEKSFEYGKKLKHFIRCFSFFQFYDLLCNQQLNKFMLSKLTSLCKLITQTIKNRQRRTEAKIQ